MRAKITKTYATFRALPRRYCGPKTMFTPRVFTGHSTTQIIMSGSAIDIMFEAYKLENEWGQSSVIEGLNIGQEVKAVNEHRAVCVIEIVEGTLEGDEDAVAFITRRLPG
jgi:hypothetical protein